MSFPSICRCCLLILVIGWQPGFSQHPLNIVREDVNVPMRDGVKLYAVVFRPETSGKYPVIVYRTPYGANHYESYAEFPRKAAKQGYVVFIVDVRGRYRSEGNFEAYRNEKRDGYDLIEWTAKQYPFSNGSVGTYGGSYPGFVQWLAMSEAPPSLKAAAPDMTPIHSHQFFYVNGAFSYGWLEWFYTNMLPDLRRRNNDRTGTWADDSAETTWEQIKFDYLYRRPMSENPLLKKYAAYYYDWMIHPERAYWGFADAEPYFSRMMAPALIHTGWYDAIYGLLGAESGFHKMRTEAATDAARKGTRLIIGPWHHTTPGIHKTIFGINDNGLAAGLDFDDLLIKWFDRHLRDTLAAEEPPVSIFVMGENRWRYENEWPLKRAVPTNYYLRDQRRLVTETPFEKEKPDSYWFDPANPLFDSAYQRTVATDQRPVESRSDVLVYTSEPLESDLEVTGRVAVELFVSSSATDTDFSFTLCDVHPDGTSVNLASLECGYLRMRYRDGTEKVSLMKPGEIYPIRIDNYYTSNLFRKGHRIRLHITSSKFPHYDVNTNTGADLPTATKMVKARQTIYHDRSLPSRIILPVIPRQ